MDLDEGKLQNKIQYFWLILRHHKKDWGSFDHNKDQNVYVMLVCGLKSKKILIMVRGK